MNSQASIFQFGTFRFDTAQQELRQRGRRVRLSVSLIKLLTLFLSRPGELVTREQIADALWDDHGTVDVAVGINTAVRRLRAILDDDPSSPQYIETVIGLGYRFIALVEAREAAAEPAAVVPDLTGIGVETEAEAKAVTSQSAEILEQTLPAGVADGPGDSHAAGEEPGSGVVSRKPARHRFFRRTAAVLTAALLVAAASVAVLKHSPHPSAGAKLVPALNPPLTEITFNGEENPITAEAISSDGNNVAYSDRFGISIHSLENGTDKLLTSPSSFHAERISWFPGRRGLAVSGVDLAGQKRVVWHVFPNGEPPQVLLSDAGQAVVSPDGGSVAYTRMADAEIWVAGGTGQNSRLLVTRVAGQRVAALLWSAKGSSLLLERVEATERETPGSPQSASFECVDAATGKLLGIERIPRFDFGFLLNDSRFVFRATVKSGGVGFMMVKTDPDTGKFLSSPEPTTKLLPLTGITGSMESLSASANGELIGAVFALHTTDTYWANLRLPGPTLSGVARLTGELGAKYPHAWTPDGDGVLFDGNDGGNFIGMQRLGQPKMEVVARMQDVPAMANFSPDGKWILFAQYAGWPGHAVAIFSMPAGGGAPRQLSTSGAIDEFHCSVSFTGSCVLRETVENREFVFYALDPIHGQGRELARASWKPTVIGDWTLSPDGLTVAMASHDPDQPAILLISLVAHGSKPIETIPVKGFGVVRASAWAVDGKGFYVQTKSASDYNLLFVDRAGHIKLLRASPISIWGIPSRDGKKLAFPSPTVRRNVWIGHSFPGTY